MSPQSVSQFPHTEKKYQYLHSRSIQRPRMNPLSTSTLVSNISTSLVTFTPKVYLSTYKFQIFHLSASHHDLFPGYYPRLLTGLDPSTIILPVPSLFNMVEE